MQKARGQSSFIFWGAAMSMDDEYHAHKRREEFRYVLAYEEFEKNRSDCIYRLLRSRGGEVRLNLQATE
jgi:hypothetical protein